MCNTNYHSLKYLCSFPINYLATLSVLNIRQGIATWVGKCYELKGLALRTNFIRQGDVYLGSRHKGCVLLSVGFHRHKVKCQG